MATPIENIGQIAINTHDVERAIAFYRDTLGLEFLFQAGPLAFFMCGDVRIMLSVAESP
jgi:catechol 2,3-dioxygenase-like lactoylglutathione lyase family enzyme